LARLKTRLAILGDAGTISAEKLRKTKALKRANKLKILVLVTFQLSSAQNTSIRSMLKTT
jgi:hypothetical protein